MAIKKGRMKSKQADGSYNIVHLETSGEQVKLNDGTTVQDLANTVATIKTGGGTALVVADITARDALTPTSGQIAYVVNATGDTTVKAGAASYIYDGVNWIKIAEFESLDLVLDWNSLENKPEIPSIKVSTTEPTGQKEGDIWIEETV